MRYLKLRTEQVENGEPISFREGPVAMMCSKKESTILSKIIRGHAAIIRSVVMKFMYVSVIWACHLWVILMIGFEIYRFFQNEKEIQWKLKDYKGVREVSLGYERLYWKK